MYVTFYSQHLIDNKIAILHDRQLNNAISLECRRSLLSKYQNLRILMCQHLIGYMVKQLGAAIRSLLAMMWLH
jgi:hypothetical protein